MTTIFMLGTIPSLNGHRFRLLQGGGTAELAQDGLPALKMVNEWTCRLNVSQDAAERLTADGTASLCPPEMYAWRTGEPDLVRRRERAHRGAPWTARGGTDP